MKMRFFRHASGLILAFTLAISCALAQDSGKSKPLDVKSDPTMIGKRDINKGQIEFYSLDKEVAIGRQLSAEVDRSSKLISDPLVSEYINRVAQNIVLHSDSKVPFTIKVIDTQEVNAFALPGGFLYVNRGLIEAADNEAEVAGVMAHEIAHVAARHGMEQASKGQLVNYMSLPLLFMGGLGGFAIREGVGLFVPLSFLKFSRAAEREADLLGAQYMWAAGYDPNALVTFFEKLEAQEKRKPGTLSKLFSTHPMTGDRITEVRKLIARFPERPEYQLSSSDFSQVKSRILSINRPMRGSGREDSSGRPTLKHKPQTGGDGDSGDSGDSSNDRPTLRRRPDTQSSDQSGDSSQQKSTQQSGTTQSGTSQSVPTQQTGSQSQPADQQSDPAPRPVLKRRPDSSN